MASFSFGAGNARKLAAIPLYAVGRAVTALVPRRRDEWVFGCGAGIGDGALALWDEAARDGVRAVWLTGSDRDARDASARGIPTVPKSSLRGFWRTARAGIVVVTHGFGDVNRYAVTGSFVVQLWHGIPLKRIGLDSPETLRLPEVVERLPGAGLIRGVLSGMYRRATRRIRVIPAASELVRGRLESAFALRSGQVPVTGEPRVDVLSRGSAPQRREAARSALSGLIGGSPDRARLVLYAPTWRDGAADPAVPDADEWRRIVDVLEETDAVMVVRSHPLGAGDYVPPFSSDRVRALGSDLLTDITPVLPAFDVLITDYSSLAFDAALVPLPTMFLAPDVAEYAARRGFYGRYDDVAGPGAAPGWSDAVVQLSGILSDPDEHARRMATAMALSERVHAHRDGRNTERVYRAIVTGSNLAPAAVEGTR